MSPRKGLEERRNRSGGRRNDAIQLLMSSDAEPGFHQREHGQTTYWINYTLIPISERRMPPQAPSGQVVPHAVRVVAPVIRGVDEVSAVDFAAMCNGGVRPLSPRQGSPVAAGLEEAAPGIGGPELGQIVLPGRVGGTFRHFSPLMHLGIQLRDLEWPDSLPSNDGLVRSLLRVGTPSVSGWWHVFTGNDSYRGVRWNPQRKDGNQTRSASLFEKDGTKWKALQTRPWVTLVQNLDGRKAIIYHNLDALAAWFDANVCLLTAVQRNAIMHALVGNGKPGGGRDKVTHIECRCTSCGKLYQANQALMQKQKGKKTGVCYACLRAMDDCAAAVNASDATGMSEQDLDAAGAAARDPDWVEPGPAVPKVYLNVDAAVSGLLEKHLKPGHGTDGSHAPCALPGGVMCILGCYDDVHHLERLASKSDEVYLVTPDLVEAAEDIPGFAYTRVGIEFREILVSGRVYKDMDLVFDSCHFKLGGVLYEWDECDSLQLNGSNVHVRLYKLKTSAGVDRLRPQRGISFKDGENTFAAWKGPNKTVVRMGRDCETVPTSVWSEVGRFYLPNNTPEVCTSHVLGSLKNNNSLTQMQIMLIVAFHSAHLRTMGTRFHRAQTSGAGERRRHRDITAGVEQRLPVPAFLEFLFDPYSDNTRYIRILLLWVFMFCCLCLAAWYARELGGGLGYLLANSREAFVSFSRAAYEDLREAGEGVGDAARAGAKMASEEIRGARDYLRQKLRAPVDEGYKWYDFAYAGAMEAHVRHVWLDDQAAGWNARAAVLWSGTLKENLITYGFSLMQPFALACILIFPVLEELLRRVRYNVREVTVRERTFQVRLCDVATGVLSLVEGGWILWNVGPDAALLRVALHLLLHWLSFKKALALHIIHNAAALTHLSRFIGPPASLPGYALSATALLVATCYESYKRRQENSRFRVLPAMFPDSQFLDYFTLGAPAFPLKDNAEIKCRGKREMKPGNELVQVMAEFAPMRSFAKSVSNILHSLHGRVCKQTIDCVNVSVHNQVGDMLALKLGSVEPDSFEDWLAHFPPAKRERYAAAKERYDVLGDSVMEDEILGAQNRWKHFKAFLKHEPNLVQPEKIVDGHKIACSDPRTIQATDDVLQTIFGPWAAAMGRREAEVFDGGDESMVMGVRILFAYGMTKKEVGKRIRKMCETGDKGIVDCGDDVFLIWGRRVYAIDASRWDAHVSIKLLKSRIHDNVRLGMPLKLAMKVHEIDTRTGSFQRSGVSYSAEGGVSSGRWDTLQANTKDGAKICLAGLISCDTWEEFVEYAASVGIVYELAADATRGVYDSRLDFCSSVFTPTEDGYTLVPKLGKALAKCCYTMHGDVPSLLASKIGALSLDLSPFPEVVLELREMLVDLPACGPTQLSYFPAGSAKPAPLHEREAFISERYGVSYDAVVCEVKDWVARSRVGVLDGGDLTTLRKLVEVDFGKKPVECPGASGWKDAPRGGPGFGWRPGWLFTTALLCGALVFFSCAGHGEGGRAVKSLRKGADYLSSITDMPAKQQQKKGVKRQQQQQRKPKQGKIKGSGSYAVPIAMLAAKVAKMLPKGTFESAGKNIGGRLGRGLAGITGVGDYVVNDIVNPTAPRRGGAHVQTISNVEYIRDVRAFGDVNFKLTEFEVNAANPAVFPWLSSVARLYTKYRFKQLLFEYRSTSTDYAATTALGSIVFAPQYNIDASSFTTKQQMEAASNAVSFKPSNNSMCGIECAAEDNNLKWYMVRSPAATPTMFTDPLAFAYAIVGSSAAAGVGLGELWVHYTVDLLEPVLSDANLGIDGKVDTFANYSTVAGAVADGCFGWRSTVPQATNAALYGNDALRLVRKDVTNAGLPLDSAWDVCFDLGDNNGNKLWFNRTGVYTFSITSKFTTGPTAGSGGMWTVGLPGGTSTTAVDIANSSPADRTVVHDSMAITINVPGSYVLFSLTAGWTANASVLEGGAVPNSQGCKVQIVYSPL